MEEYKGLAKSYEHAKLKAIEACLTTIGIFIEDELGKITIKQNGDVVATITISI